MLVVCLFIAIVSNAIPVDITSTVNVDGTNHTVQNVNDGGKLAMVLSSLFESIKMMGFGFDRDKAAVYLAHFLDWKNYWSSNLFGIAYIFSSLTATFFSSVIVALTLFNNFTIKVRTFFKSLNTSKEIYYLFSDTDVHITAKLAEELKRDGHIVVIYLSRASQMTQAGTEFKDSLLSKGFDVRIETFGNGLTKFLFKNSFNKYFCPFFRLFGYRRRKICVFGLFSNDETSIELASGFKKAIVTNGHFSKIRRKVYCSTQGYGDLILNLSDQSQLDYISGNKKLDKDKEEDKRIIKGAHKTLACLANALGLSEVIDKRNQGIRKFIKQNKLGDTDFPYLLNHFLDGGLEINKIIGFSSKKRDKWIKLLVSYVDFSRTIKYGINSESFLNYLQGKKSNINDIKDAQNTLILLSTVIGIKKVANLNNPIIKSYIKKNKFTNGDFATLLQYFALKNVPIREIVGFKDGRIKEWEKRLPKTKVKETKKGEIDVIRKYRIFLTYHESDIDITSHYSDATLHILNTLSQYDIISSEFVLNNQLTNFLKINKNTTANVKEIIETRGDVSKKTTKKTLNMHVTFFGFGKINRPIFEKMTSAYQLWDDNENKVHYHIVDKESELRKASVINRYSNGVYTPIEYGKDSLIKRSEISKVKPPFLYDISADCNGQDLTSYNTINDYIKGIFEKDNNRFNKNGFEIFIISLCNTSSDIKVAQQLRSAILEYSKNSKGKTLARSIIFVRVANRLSAESIFNTNVYVKSQEHVNGGLIVNRPKDKKSLAKIENELVPIVTFGENALMSTYISKHFDTINNYAIEAYRSYCGLTIEQAEKEWLLLDKKEALSNVATIYSLKPKLSLLGYKLDDNYMVKPDSSEMSFKEYLESNKAFNHPTDYGNYEEEMKLLAALEHNRWVAAVAQIYNYGQMSIDYFANINKFKTKTEDNTLHVCMLSNEGLRVFRNAIITSEKYKNKEDKIAKLWKITLVYDINAIKMIFESLRKRAEEEEKKKSKSNKPSKVQAKN